MLEKSNQLTNLTDNKVDDLEQHAIRNPYVTGIKAQLQYIHDHIHECKSKRSRAVAEKALVEIELAIRGAVWRGIRRRQVVTPKNVTQQLN